VALICELIAFAGRGEGLAGARACPNRSVVGPSGKAQGVTPTADSGEEMALGISAQVVGLDFDDGAFINFSVRDVTAANQLAQPCSGKTVVLVVIGDHCALPDDPHSQHLAVMIVARQNQRLRGFGTGGDYAQESVVPCVPDFDVVFAHLVCSYVPGTYKGRGMLSFVLRGCPYFRPPGT
jgi:hypothetical protein